MAEAGKNNLANDDVNTNDSHEVVEFRVAKLADKSPHPPPQKTLPQQNPSNQAADPPRDDTMNLEKILTQVTGDDELFSKTVQIDKNAGNYEVAESDDANHVIDKNILISIMLKPTWEMLSHMTLNPRFPLKTMRPTSLMPV